MAATIETDERMTTEEVAEFLGLSPATLETWRTLGKGPAFVKPGRRIFYLRSDVVAYLESRRVRSTAQLT